MATEVMTTRAVAERFQVTRATVSRWVAAGHLTPFTKTTGARGAFLFDRDEVERFERDRAAA